MGTIRVFAGTLRHGRAPLKKAKGALRGRELRVEHMIQILPHAILVVLIDFPTADVLRLLHVRRITERILQRGLLTVVSAGRTGGGGFIGRAADRRDNNDETGMR